MTIIVLDSMHVVGHQCALLFVVSPGPFNNLNSVLSIHSTNTVILWGPTPCFSNIKLTHLLFRCLRIICTSIFVCDL
jgi:hypothetical protein